MPYISRASYSLNNQGIVTIAGSGFSKSGFRIDRYGYLDSRDDPASSLRFPQQVVSGFIQNGLTYSNIIASGNRYSHTSNVVWDDNTCAIRVEHYNKLWSKSYLLAAFNTSEGSGNLYWCNRPEIYKIETNTVQKNRAYKIWGRNLFQRIDYNVTNASTPGSPDGDTDYYYPIIYLASTGNLNQLYRCTNLGPDGVTQEKHEESWFGYTNFIVPTGVPDGTYNLYYYTRANEASIAVSSGLRVFSTIPSPSSTIFRTSDYFTSSDSSNRSQEIQNLIYIAASSVLANPNSQANIVFEPKTYLLNNSVFVVSGVNLVGDNTKLIFSPDLSYVRLYSVSIPTRFNGTQTGATPYYGGIHLSEYCGMRGFHIDIGDERMAPPYGIVLSSFLTNATTDVYIKDCTFHTAFAGDSTTIFNTNDKVPSTNVAIEDNEFRGYYILGSYKFSTGTVGNKVGWSVQRNTFAGNCNRAGGTAIGGVGSYSVIAQNTFTNFLRGIVHSSSNGTAACNLIANNQFSEGANYFNSSEYLLFETNSAARYYGGVINITPSSCRIPQSSWTAIHPYLSGVNAWKDYYVVVREGTGKGQDTYVIGNTADGFIQIAPFTTPIDSGSTLLIGSGPNRNNICNNKFNEALGGLEFYGSAVNNYVSKNELLRSGRGLHLYTDLTVTDSKINNIWWNHFDGNIFHDSQILVDTPVTWTDAALPSRTGANLISYNTFNNLTMLDSPFSYTGRTVPETQFTAISGNTILPIFTYNTFPFIQFDTQNWRASAFKVVNVTPFNCPPVLCSGMLTKAKFINYANGDPITRNTIAVNGYVIPLESGTKTLTGPIGNTTGGGGPRKWGWA